MVTSKYLENLTPCHFSKGLKHITEGSNHYVERLISGIMDVKHVLTLIKPSNFLTQPMTRLLYNTK